MPRTLRPQRLGYWRMFKALCSTTFLLLVIRFCCFFCCWGAGGGEGGLKVGLGFYRCGGLGFQVRAVGLGFRGLGLGFLEFRDDGLWFRV